MTDYRLAADALRYQAQARRLRSDYALALGEIREVMALVDEAEAAHAAGPWWRRRRQPQLATPWIRLRLGRYQHQPALYAHELPSGDTPLAVLTDLLAMYDDGTFNAPAWLAVWKRARHLVPRPAETEQQ